MICKSLKGPSRYTLEGRGSRSNILALSFMQSALEDFIDSAGWLEWDGNFALQTLYYGEYKNTGAGAATSNRVSWPGFHVITSATEAARFTVGQFISGNSWIPATGVAFTAGLN